MPNKSRIHNIGAPLLAAQAELAELQTLLELTTYTEPVKDRILELLKILGCRLAR